MNPESKLPHRLAIAVDGAVQMPYQEPRHTEHNSTEAERAQFGVRVPLKDVLLHIQKRLLEEINKDDPPNYEPDEGLDP